MRRLAYSILVVTAWCASACTESPSEPPVPPSVGDSSGSSTGWTGVVGTDGGSTSMAEPSTSEQTGDDGTFIPAPDGGGGMSQCDPWAQDCPKGDKCVPYRSPGGSTWDANRCVPVVANPKLTGEACSELGAPQGGEDDCDATSICNYIVDGQGLCVAMCTGSAIAPLCEDTDTSCNIDNDGTRNLCTPICDPLLQDCPDNSRMTCLVSNGSDSFNCELGWGDAGIPVGDECVFDNACLNGNLCIFDATVVPDCQGVGCCTPYCDVGTPECPHPETECVPFFNEGEAPPSYTHVGVCLIPT